MGDIIRGALEQNELVNCSKLFMNFYTLANTGKSKNKTGYEDLVVPFIVNGEVSLPKEMEQIWEDDKLGVAADTSSLKLSEEASFEEINLEALGSNLVHILSEKLFSKGVQLDIKIPDGLFIRASQEAVEQALYHLFIYAINSVELLTPKRPTPNPPIDAFFRNSLRCISLNYWG